MKLYDYEWQALKSMFATAKTDADRKALFEMWIEEKCQAWYTSGWNDACFEYEIDEGIITDDDDDDDDEYDYGEY